MKKTLKLIGEFIFVASVFTLLWASLWIFAQMKKIDNYKDMEIWADISFLASTILKEYNNKKTSNLEAMADAIARLTFYFQENLNNKRLYKKALSEYRLAKNRAIERARKAEEENEKLKLKIKKYANL